MSKQLSISAHASALALVLLALVGAASDLHDTPMASGAELTPFSVATVIN
ncbi:hypothetical protein [Pontixanthobacter sp. CEM42]|nr:hypothetical protein [Pontixanthobacter sp. CEM42]